MRKIKTSQIKDKVKELFLKANYHLDQDLMHGLEGALEEEETPPRCLLGVIASKEPALSVPAVLISPTKVNNYLGFPAIFKEGDLKVRASSERGHREQGGEDLALL